MNTEPTILDDIDPDLAATFTSRRGLFTRAAAKLGALATAPTVLGVASTEAFGQGVPRRVVDVLNFALTLEYLEDEFYRTALAAPGLIPFQFRRVFETISRHETAHVRLLQTTLGGAAVGKPQFDLTAGGRYPDVLRNFGTFSLLSQTFEDLGVAAYKGQAGNLLGTGKILTTALQIHSVEARHAAEVRAVRGVRSWDGAFDQPKSKAQVLAAAGPFIAGSGRTSRARGRAG